VIIFKAHLTSFLACFIVITPTQVHVTFLIELSYSNACFGGYLICLQTREIACSLRSLMCFVFP
jgi:hypothetical protein